MILGFYFTVLCMKWRNSGATGTWSVLYTRLGTGTQVNEAVLSSILTFREDSIQLCGPYNRFDS